LKENAVLLIFERQRRPTSLRACSKAKIVRQRRLAGKLGQDVTGQSDRHRVRPGGSGARRQNCKKARRRGGHGHVPQQRSDRDAGEHNVAATAQRSRQAGAQQGTRPAARATEQAARQPGVERGTSSSAGPEAGQQTCRWPGVRPVRVCVAYVCFATFFLFFYPNCTNTSVVTSMLLFFCH
jgi:hypothetical protein